MANAPRRRDEPREHSGSGKCRERQPLGTAAETDAASPPLDGDDHPEYVPRRRHTVRLTGAVAADEHAAGGVSDHAVYDQPTGEGIADGDHIAEARPLPRASDREHVAIADERVHTEAAGGEAEGGAARERGAHELQQPRAAQRVLAALRDRRIHESVRPDG